MSTIELKTSLLDWGSGLFWELAYTTPIKRATCLAKDDSPAEQQEEREREKKRKGYDYASFFIFIFPK